MGRRDEVVDGVLGRRQLGRGRNAVIRDPVQDPAGTLLRVGMARQREGLVRLVVECRVGQLAANHAVGLAVSVGRHAVAQVEDAGSVPIQRLDDQHLEAAARLRALAEMHDRIRVAFLWVAVRRMELGTAEDGVIDDGARQLCHRLVALVRARRAGCHIEAIGDGAVAEIDGRAADVQLRLVRPDHNARLRHGSLGGAARPGDLHRLHGCPTDCRTGGTDRIIEHRRGAPGVVARRVFAVDRPAGQAAAADGRRPREWLAHHPGGELIGADVTFV